MMTDHQGVRRRDKSNKDALKDRLEEIRRTMKQKEASQERKKYIISCVKPISLGLLIILLVIFLYYLYLKPEGENVNSVSETEDNMLMEDYSSESVVIEDK